MKFSFYISALIFLGTISVIAQVPDLAAATLEVVNANDSGAGSLRQAVVDAEPGDTIIFDLNPAATPVLLASEISIDKNITIQGNIQNRNTLSGNNSTRLFHVTSGVVVLENLILSEGSVADGSGGGILNQGQLTLRNCLVTANEVTGVTSSGGGIANTGAGAYLSILKSTFQNNSAYYGGGVSNISGDILLQDTTFLENDSSGTLTSGGGLYNASGTVTVERSLFRANVSAGNGGAIANSTGEMTIVNSTIFNTIAAGKGGGVHQAGSGNSDFVHVSYSTFSSNYANSNNDNPFERGGGINKDLGIFILRGCLLESNFALVDGVLQRDNCSGLIDSNGGNAMADRAGCNGDFLEEGFPNVNGDYLGGPNGGVLGYVLGSLQDNGGYTQTMLPDAESYVVKAVAGPTVEIDGGLVRVDQRGYQRSAKNSDIGAVQVSSAANILLMIPRKSSRD